MAKAILGLLWVVDDDLEVQIDVQAISELNVVRKLSLKVNNMAIKHICFVVQELIFGSAV